jgi:hypothetical protein
VDQPRGVEPARPTPVPGPVEGGPGQVVARHQLDLAELELRPARGRQQLLDLVQLGNEQWNEPGDRVRTDQPVVVQVQRVKVAIGKQPFEGRRQFGCRGQVWRRIE